MMLKDKTIIVTGGNSGIGEAIVEAAAAEGANVVIDYISDKDELPPLIEKVTASGGKALAVKADVSQVGQLQTLVDTAVREFGRLDVMINNAGIETRSSVLECTEEDYDRTLNVNLKSAFFGTQLAAKQFIAQGDGGLVINISSVHEEWPMPGNAAYCVSKGGTRMLAKNAGAELGPHGVRVINVAPGAVATPINDETMSDPEQRRKLEASIPLGRVASPEEIASLVVLLASPGAGYMTGTTVFVDGGIMQGAAGL